MGKPAAPQEKRKLTGVQLVLLLGLIVALLGSVGMRAYSRSKQQAAGGASGAGGIAGATALTADGEPRDAPQPEGLESALPYVTEASFFGLIGFALGYASRKFVKVGLILLALFFVGLQALVWTGSVSVDWQSVIGKLNELVFNLKQNESVTQFLTRRIPSGGGLLAGYLFGFQRG